MTYDLNHKVKRAMQWKYKSLMFIIINIYNITFILIIISIKKTIIIKA